MSARLHGEEAEQFIERELAEFAVNSVLWEFIYIAPATGAYWLKTYPHSEYHGGGPADLEPISSEAVLHKLDSEEGWERREVPQPTPGPPVEFDAEIRLTGDRPSFNGDLNGQRPSFNFGGELTACQVNCAPGNTREFIGQPIQARIHLFYTTPAHRSIGPGSEFKLNVGGVSFASGAIRSDPRVAA